MKGYLLDTNIIEFWFNSKRAEHEAVRDRIATLPAETPLATSAVVIGEIRYGTLVAPKEQQVGLSEFVEFVRKQLPTVWEISRSTAATYGELRARLFEKYAPKDKKKQGLRPEQLIDPETSLQLGIQENDLWIAAQAVERNLVLATNDRMMRISEVVPELIVEDWAKPTS